jgi:hypothetical protein
MDVMQQYNEMLRFGERLTKMKTWRWLRGMVVIKGKSWRRLESYEVSVDGTPDLHDRATILLTIDLLRHDPEYGDVREKLEEWADD